MAIFVLTFILRGDCNLNNRTAMAFLRHRALGAQRFLDGNTYS